MKIINITEIADFCLALKIRLEVFVKEQGVPVDLEIDEYDAQAHHYLVIANDIPVATARLLIQDRCAKVGRFAVLKKYRSQKVGTLLAEKMKSEAIRFCCTTIILDAQMQAMGFYKKLGYSIRGESFMDASIEHIEMVLMI